MASEAPAIRALGEIALRVLDLEQMQTFYQDVVGLTLMKRFPRAAFFRVADGYGGHTQILALFDRSTDEWRSEPDAKRSTVDHIAFTIDLADFAAERDRLNRAGLDVETRPHPWVHWRSLYFPDPEGNLVEFVCYDEAVT